MKRIRNPRQFWGMMLPIMVGLVACGGEPPAVTESSAPLLTNSHLIYGTTNVGWPWGNFSDTVPLGTPTNMRRVDRANWHGDFTPPGYSFGFEYAHVTNYNGSAIIKLDIVENTNVGYVGQGWEPNIVCTGLLLSQMPVPGFGLHTDNIVDGYINPWWGTYPYWGHIEGSAPYANNYASDLWASNTGTCYGYYNGFTARKPRIVEVGYLPLSLNPPKDNDVGSLTGMWVYMEIDFPERGSTSRYYFQFDQISG